jgi:hypothetical protein
MIREITNPERREDESQLFCILPSILGSELSFLWSGGEEKGGLVLGRQSDADVT